MFLIPANATKIAPPIASAGEVAVFSEGGWSVTIDIRGNWYDADGSVVVVDSLDSDVSGLSRELSTEQLRSQALQTKLAEILEQRKNRNNVWDFVFDGNQYVNDEQNIQGVKVQVLDKPLTDPIPTFPGLPVAGCWRTSDDQYVPFTNQLFMSGLCEAYFAVRSFNFGWYGVLCSQVAALETKEEIEAFDTTAGWHSSTVVP